MKIELIESCADDLSVVNSARVSLAAHSEWADPELNLLSTSDTKLIGYLMRNRHGSPFEHGYLRFLVEAPIFVIREWHRHRAGHSYNEVSGRYVKLEPKFYRPDCARVQEGKPGAYSFIERTAIDPTSVFMRDAMSYVYEAASLTYEALLEAGVAKEQARAVLPVGLYSQMYWSCNPRSLMHFISLRNSEHAMKEIRELAATAEEYFEDLMPVTYEAFVSNGRVCP